MLTASLHLLQDVKRRRRQYDVTRAVERAHLRAHRRQHQTGAVEIEAFLDDTHPSLNVEQTSNETTPGTYTVGPVRFDVSGKWTVRFHIHDA